MRREALDQFVAMFVNAPYQVTRDAGVKRGIIAVRHDIDE